MRSMIRCRRPAAAVVIMLALAAGGALAQEPGDLGEDVALSGAEATPYAGDAENIVGFAGEDQLFRVQVDGEIVEIAWVVTESGDVFVQGDIFVGKMAQLDLEPGTSSLQSLQSLQLFGLFRRGDATWPLGIVPYEIDERLRNGTAIQAAIAGWEKATEIRFRPREHDDEDYVVFVAEAEAQHCSSSVGRVGGRQLIRLGEACGIGSIAHEIGHALGLAHEHMRSDRPRFVRYFRQNVLNGYERQFAPDTSRYRDTGRYCHGSLMHYGEYAFSRQPGALRTLSAINGAKIGQRQFIAGCDRQVIDAVYRKEFDKRR